MKQVHAVLSYLKGFRTFLLAAAVAFEALLEPIFISGADISWGRFWLAVLFAVLRALTDTRPGARQ